MRAKVPGVMDGCRYANSVVARSAARKLHAVVMSPARHPDVQRLQDVFRDARLQCWQWLVGPEVPAENNRSEREVGPLAAARKSSHGSQSDRGAETRGVFIHFVSLNHLDSKKRQMGTILTVKPSWVSSPSSSRVMMVRSPHPVAFAASKSPASSRVRVSASDMSQVT